MITFLTALFLVLSPLRIAENQIVNQRYEIAVGFGADGYEVCRATSHDLSFVEVPPDCVEMIRDTGFLLHNHVWILNSRYERDCPSFSPGDVLFAGATNLSKTVVVSRWYGHVTEITITRAPTGWNLKLFDLLTIYGRYRAWLKYYGVCSALSATWTELAPKLGFTYKVIYR